MKFIEKFVDLPRLIKTLYIMLWAIMLIFVILKLVFNIWYPIAVESVTFMKVCNFVDDTPFIKLALNFILFILTANIIFLSFIGKWKYDKLVDCICINVLLIIIFVVKMYITIIGSLLDITLIVLSIIINIKSNRFTKTIMNILSPIIIYILLNLWQLNILFIKDINEILSNAPTLVLILIQSDYHIFLLITWMGVNIFMGISSLGWFFGKSDSELKEIRARELSKKAPDLKMVAEIEKILKDRKVEF